jgi:rod shape-determining protein MreC
MRYRRIDRYLLVLAGLFVLAILRRTDLPGEEVLPDLYRATIHQPLLAQATDALAEPELEFVRLRSELEVARHEIERLKGQLEARDELRGFFRAIRWPEPPVAIPGWVFSVETDAWRRTFRISCGTEDQVESGLPVVTGKALLGLVLVAQRRQSVVRRVDDPGFRIDVELESGDGFARGVAHGTGNGGLELRFLRAARELERGTRVFTSSYDPLVPPGLLVGLVEDVEDPERDGVWEVAVTPAASLGRLAQVEVLRRR